MNKLMLLCCVSVLVFSSLVGASCYDLQSDFGETTNTGYCLASTQSGDDVATLSGFQTASEAPGQPYCVWSSNSYSWCRSDIPAGYKCIAMGDGHVLWGYRLVPPNYISANDISDDEIYPNVYPDGTCYKANCRPGFDVQDCLLTVAAETGDYSKEYCGSTTNTCEVKLCSKDSDCPQGICVGGVCKHVMDFDEDGLPGSIMDSSRNFPVDINTPIREYKYDCVDYTKVCAVNTNDSSCVDSAKNSKGYRASSEMKDCWDYCIDRDGDWYCDKTSVRYADWKSLKLNVDYYKTGLLVWITTLKYDIGAGDALTPKMTGVPNSIKDLPDKLGVKIQNGWSEANAGTWTMADLEKYMPFDCNDDDPAVNPGVKEETMANPCDFVDNDCDKKVDECAKDVVFDGCDAAVRNWIKTIKLNETAVTAAVNGAGINAAEKTIIITSTNAHPEYTLIALWNLMVFAPSSNKALVIPAIKSAFGFSSAQTTILGYVVNVEGYSLDPLSDDELNVSIGSKCRESHEKSCVYALNFNGCQALDYDGDGYKNASFGCPDCTDCNDFDASINPGAVDNTVDTIDQNCNGLDGEQLDTDGDSIPDIYENPCKFEGRSAGPIDHLGCWFSTLRDNLVRWASS